MAQWQAFGQVQSEGPLGFPTRRLPSGALFGDPRALLSNPGGASAIDRQLFQYRSRDPMAPIPGSIAASKTGMFQGLSAIPESEPNTQAIIRYPRISPISSHVIGDGVPDVSYNAPGVGQLAFAITDRGEPTFRARGVPTPPYRTGPREEESKRWVDQMQLTHPADMYRLQQVNLISLGSVHHLTCCREAHRMMRYVNALSQRGVVGQAAINDAWNAFLDEMDLTDPTANPRAASIAAVTRDITFDGIVSESDAKRDRRQIAGNPKNRALTVIMAARAMMRNYMFGRKALEGAHIHLVKRRAPMSLNPSSPLIFRTHGANDPYLDAANTTLQLNPNPYRGVPPGAAANVAEEIRRTHTIYPVFYFVVAVTFQGPLPSKFLHYKAYGRDFFDGQDIYLGYLMHRGDFAADGGLKPTFYDDTEPTPENLQYVTDEYRLSQRYSDVEMLISPDYE